MLSSHESIFALATAWQRDDCRTARERELERMDSHWQHTGRSAETEVSVIHSARAVYVANPKVGSSFIGTFLMFLEADDQSHRTSHHNFNVAMPGAAEHGNKVKLLTLDQTVPRHYKLFTFVREPLARTVSAFGEISRRGAYPLNVTCEERSRQFGVFVEQMERGAFVWDRDSNRAHHQGWYPGSESMTRHDYDDARLDARVAGPRERLSRLASGCAPRRDTRPKSHLFVHRTLQRDLLGSGCDP